MPTAPPRPPLRPRRRFRPRRPVPYWAVVATLAVASAGAVGVVFKGSGFYKTDSRGKAPSSGESKPATESSSAPAKTESSSAPAASTTSSTPASKTA